MADSLYVKVGDAVEQLDLGSNEAPEYVQRIEALEQNVASNQATQSAKDAAQDAAIAGKLDKSGGTMTGTLVLNDAALRVGPYDGIYEAKESANAGVGINANSSDGRGAALVLRDIATGGAFALGARDASVAKYMFGRTDGSLTWDGKNLVCTVNGVAADAAGNVTVATPKAYITETWVSGTSWYRKYSDGWIEQGGKLPAQSVTNYKLTLNKAFSSANYFIIKSMGSSSLEQVSGAYRDFRSLTATTAITNQGADYNYSYWYACGY